jgi:xanthine/uracil/vitamin C permease (AzgA family)
MLAVVGLTLIATLSHRGVPGSIIIGIFLTAIGCVTHHVTWIECSHCMQWRVEPTSVGTVAAGYSSLLS